MRRVLMALCALLPARVALAADDPLPLKPGPGVELATAACNGCHTSDYIVMNSTFLPPAAWKAEVAKMRAAFGAPIDDGIAAAITDYLVANYAAQ